MSNLSVMKKNVFDEKDVLHELKHYLPSQTPLKDFVHHNSLHAYQNMKFYNAIFKASKMFGYQVTFQLNEYRKLLETGRIKKEILEKAIKQRKKDFNYKEWESKVLEKNYDVFIDQRVGKIREKWKKAYKIDLDNLVQPLLFRIIGAYLDQGISLWQFPFENEGLINSIRKLEEKSFTSFFKTSRARRLLFDNSITITNLLSILVGDENFFEQYLFDQQFSHRGWSGIVSSIEDRPDTVLYPKKISLKDFIILELLLEIDSLEHQFRTNWKSLAQSTKLEKIDLFKDISFTEHQEVLMIWHDAFEWSFYDQVLSTIKVAQENKKVSQKVTSFQAVMCMDDRIESIRRHLEIIDSNCETFGAPGFFGVEFYFHPYNGKFYEKLCPAPVTPKYLIKEIEPKSHEKYDVLHSKKSHTLFRGFISSLPLGILASVKLFSNIFNPKINSSIYDSFSHTHMNTNFSIENKNLDDRENGLQIGFTIEEMVTRVENFLQSIALTKNFASIIYIIGHGSRSANNPYQHGYDCGACSGRPGDVNARVFCFMANHTKVREILKTKNIDIPETTQFIPAIHNTTSDEVLFYNEDTISELNSDLHIKNKLSFQLALENNSKERSRRFESINTKNSIKKIHNAIKKRAVSYFEPRPELNHSTNALCIVGPRDLTKNIFLDRRAFMNSYDYKTDPDGKVLLNVMKPLPPVAGGINLEYYFSRMDNYKLGAGTKLPHNVMGLIGVANSSDGDLRAGLPSQMIEVHDPIRLLMIVEHYPEIILKTISSLPDLYEWFVNEWVHLVSLNPKDGNLYLFKDGKFEPYEILNKDIKTTDNLNKLIESVKEASSTYIIDATEENLPVHIITKE